MSKKKRQTDIAIIGMSCLFPMAKDLKEYWRLIFREEDGITDVPETHWSANDYYHEDTKKPDHTYCKRGGFLSSISYDPSEFGIPPNILEATDTSQLLALVVAKAALKDAGYLEEKPFNREKTSVILGATGTQELVIPLGARLGHPFWRRALEESGIPDDKSEEVIKRISASYVSWQENSFPGLLGNVVAGRISNRLDLGGTNTVVDAACASSLSAVNLALMELQSGRSDMVITGGVDTLNDIFMHMCFAQTGVLSHTGNAKPFSADADGTVLGEGVGMLVLKRLDNAEKDGDRIYATIKGAGTSSDGKSQSIYAPDAKGQARSLRSAYENAGISPDTIELIEAHGTGTRVGDAVEFSALKEVFGQYCSSGNRCAVGSVKSMIGHTKAAAGSAGLIKSVLSLHHKVLPPTIKVDRPDPKLGIEESPFYLNTSSKPWLSVKDHPRRSGVSSFGFGGSNFHIVLEEYSPDKKKISWYGTSEIIALSGDTKQAIIKELQDFHGLESFDEIARAASQSRIQFSPNAAHRLLLVVEKTGNNNTNFLPSPDDIITTASNALTKRSEKTWELQNIFYGSNKTKKMAFIFPGQGSQYPGMGKEIVCTFPEALNAVEHAKMLFAKENKELQETLDNLIFPPPDHLIPPETHESRLRQTDITQPAIGAISLAMLKALKVFNIIPDAVCGHSFGELTALYSAGRINEKDFLTLSVARGRLMAAAGKGEDNGSMLAVKAPIKEIEKLIQENNLDLVLANRNTHTQGVLAGTTAGIKKAEKLCKKKNFSTMLLQVSAAFHSDHVKSAAKPFKQRLQSIEFASSDIPVYANTTGAPYPASGSDAKKLLGNQLIKPVNFTKEIENLYETGVRTFVEVGPKQVLTGLVTSILNGKDIRAISLDSSSGRLSGTSDLARVLCLIASSGHSIQLDAWEDSSEETVKQRMSIPITGANYRSESEPIPKSEKMIISKPSSQVEPHTDKHPQSIRQNIMNEKTETKISHTMINNKSENVVFINDALKVIQENLKSMQSLQSQTADAHKKFLDAQTEASRTMRAMINQTRQMAESFFDGKPVVHYDKMNYQAIPSVSKTQNTPSHDTATNQIKPSEDMVSDQQENKGVRENHKAIKETLLEVVSKLTGYPIEMLGLDMNIEADLGIDSIKRVEILSTLEEQIPGLPPVSPDIMGNMKSLGQVAEYFINSDTNLLSTMTDTGIPEKPEVSTSDHAKEIEETILKVVSRLTGYPIDMLGMEMDIEADLGIDSIKRVEILSTIEEQMPGLPPVSPEILGSMKTLGQITEYLAKGQASSQQANIPTETDPQALHHQEFEKIMLDSVSRLTGYPVDMLGMEMDIEADLGIDSIKRVEILSTIEEQIPGLPPVSPEILGTMKTLGQIVDHLSGTSAQDDVLLKEASPDISASVITQASERENKPLSSGTAQRQIIEIIEKPFEKVKTVSIPKDRVIYLSGNKNGLARAVAAELENRGIKSSIITTTMQRNLIAGGNLIKNAGGLIILSEKTKVNGGIWNPSDEVFLKNAFSLANLAATELLISAAAEGAVFATLTRLDGCFGFKDGKMENPMRGGLAGLAKTAAIEWENVCCTAIDVARGWKNNKALAKQAVDEIFNYDPENIEIGLDSSTRMLPMLKQVPYPKGIINLSEDDVVVITGGARGVTAECAFALAEHSHPTLVLVGRSQFPSEEPEWLDGIDAEADIKKAILVNEFSDTKTTPLEIERSYKRHMANREIIQTLEKLKSAGTSALYYSADVRDKAGIRSLFKDIRNKYGPIKAVIHGAGIVEDRLIKDKNREQFEKVFYTKINGLKSITEALLEDELRYLVLFSSVTARMGNKGQVDYAMANEAMNKIARSIALKNQSCRIISINWGPWDGGMVSPLLKKEFARNNIEMIPIPVGAECMLNEMKGDFSEPVEVVIGGKIIPDREKLDVFNNQEPTKHDKLTLLFKRTIDIQSHPILGDHVLGGKPVVPFALLTEWLGHSALHDNPGLYLQGIDDMRLLSGIKIDGSSRIIRLMSGKAVKKGSLFEVSVEIRNGLKDGKEVIHSRGKAILADLHEAPPFYNKSDSIDLKTYSRSIEEAYEKILFHGSQLRGIRDITGYSKKGMQARISTAPQPMKWMTDPLRSRWISDPLVLDSAFQMASLWCYETTGVVSLPSYCKTYRQYRPDFPEEITALLEITDISDYKIRGDFTFTGPDNTVIAIMTGYEAIMDSSLNEAFKPGGISC